MDGLKPTIDGINATVTGWFDWLADGVTGWFDEPAGPSAPATKPVQTATAAAAGKTGLLVAGVALVAAGFLLARK